ncbi:MAG: helicase-related protein [Verrucomicrobiota bacterium]|jgi:superfamily II DNA or RNA helicase
MSESPKGGELFIVDNSETDWKGLRYLQDWTEIASSFDIATGFFEIGSLLALDGRWQKLEAIRILMGGQATARTRQAILEGLRKDACQKLDASLEAEKETNDMLVGAGAILDAMRGGKIQCRVYARRKFHAKAYITHPRLAVIGSVALVGSSNFTVPGLTENVELNIQIRAPGDVSQLQAWYERHWQEAEDITPDVLKVIERHIREYLPFDIYAKAMQEFHRGHEMTDDEWEKAGAQNGGSAMYPHLDKYQQDGYKSLMKIARQHRGAFLCDGVGLGKTFIGLMLIERLIRDRQRVVLIVPKAARGPVWDRGLRRYLPNISRVFTNLEIFNHTDLLRGGEYQQKLDDIATLADAVVIDEAHHFRNPGTRGRSRYWRLFDLVKNKNLFLLTATPINNTLLDLQHMIELFTQRQADYFKGAPLGIHSLPGHFRKMEKELERLVTGEELAQMELIPEVTGAEAGKVLADDALFGQLVVQRSRAYVKASQDQGASGPRAIFPTREDPHVANYSIKKTYGGLLKMVEEAFSKKKPLFSLAMYYPLAYYKGSMADIDPLSENRQRSVVALIRTQFLKRFESSASAFEMSCATLMLKLLAWATKHSVTESEKNRLERWRRQHADLLGYIHEHQLEFFGEEPVEEADEDIVTDEMLEDIEALPREEYKVEEILAETSLDLDQIAKFLGELGKFKPSHDDKLKALLKLLKTNPVLKQHKVLIFSEYRATARYLRKHLAEAGVQGADEVDSADKRDRGEVIERFAPYYNESSAAELAARGLPEIRVLISTDVLSEGLNLQDATRLINYDLHWNPVRLMQRIGRVDRRLNPDTEKRILADHPDQKDLRGTVAYWNFLPPEELDDLLRLYRTVSHKTLRISKTFGIEGKKLLTPQDDFEALHEFNQAYEGTPSATEGMHLEYQRLLEQNPGLEERLNSLPGRVFSGKQHPAPGTRALFFCYRLPAPGVAAHEGREADPTVWSEENGSTAWYLYNLDTTKILEEPAEILNFIRCQPDTPRRRALEDKTLGDIRKKVEAHLKNTYLKKVQAPQGVKATLKCWMELG